MKLIKKELYKVTFVDAYGKHDSCRIAASSIQDAMEAATAAFKHGILSVQEMGWVEVVVPLK